MGHVIELARMAGVYKLQLISGKHRAEAHDFYRSMSLNAVARVSKSISTSSPRPTGQLRVCITLIERKSRRVSADRDVWSAKWASTMGSFMSVPAARLRPRPAQRA